MEAYMNLLGDKMKLVRKISKEINPTNTLKPGGNSASILLYHIPKSTRFWLQRILDVPSDRDNFNRLREFYDLPENSHKRVAEILELKVSERTAALNREFKKAFHPSDKIHGAFEEAFELIEEVKGSNIDVNRTVDLNGFYSSIGVTTDVVKVLMHVYGHTTHHLAQLQAMQ